MENYKEKYDTALEGIQEILSSGQDSIKMSRLQLRLQGLFPELKESEGERMVKFIKNQLFNIKKTITENYELDAKLTKAIDWLEKQESVREVVERCKNSWYNEGKIAGMAEGLTNDEKYQQGWHDALEKQGEQKPFDYENANIQQKDFASVGETATIELSSPIDCGDRIYHVSHKPIEKNGEQKPILDFKASNFYVSKVDGKIHNIYYSVDKVEPKFKVRYAGGEYNVLEVKDIAGVTFYGIEDEPNHIDYVKAENCEIISGYAIKENGSPYPTKSAVFSEKKPTAWSEEDDYNLQCMIAKVTSDIQKGNVGRNNELIDWLKSLKDRIGG